MNEGRVYWQLIRGEGEGVTEAHSTFDIQIIFANNYW